MQRISELVEILAEKKIRDAREGQTHPKIFGNGIVHLAVKKPKKKKEILEILQRFDFVDFEANARAAEQRLSQQKILKFLQPALLSYLTGFRYIGQHQRARLRTVLDVGKSIPRRERRGRDGEPLSDDRNPDFADPGFEAELMGKSFFEGFFARK